MAGHGASHHGDGSPQPRLASKSHENPGKLAEVFIEAAADAFMETGLYLKLVLKPPCLHRAEEGGRVCTLISPVPGGAGIALPFPALPGTSSQPPPGGCTGSTEHHFH